MAASIATVRTVKDLRAAVAKWRKAGETVGVGNGDSGKNERPTGDEAM